MASIRMLIIGTVAVVLLVVVFSVVAISSSSSSNSIVVNGKTVTTKPGFIPTTMAPTTMAPTTMAPTTMAPTTMAPTTMAPTTMAPTTMAPTTMAPTTMAPTTMAPTTMAPTTMVNKVSELLKGQYLQAPFVPSVALRPDQKFASTEPYLISPNGSYRLYLNFIGNVMMYNTTTTPWRVTWTSPLNLVDNNSVDQTGKVSLRLIFQDDGNLVLYYSDNNFNTKGVSWNSGTYGRGGNKLVLQNDGNLVIYRNMDNTSPIWSTITGML